MKEKVLIADDEKEWFDAIYMHCKNEFDLYYAANCEERLRKTLEVKPNLIMTDSLRANSQVNSKFRELAMGYYAPVIFFTKGQITANKLSSVGAKDFLKKPSHPQELNFDQVIKIIEKNILMSKNEMLEQENKTLKSKLKYDTSPIIVNSLKDWLKRYPDSNAKIFSYGFKEYSLNDIIKEIDDGSNIGKELIKAWINLIIKMSLRKENG